MNAADLKRLASLTNATSKGSCFQKRRAEA